MGEIKTFADVINLWPKPGANSLASDIGVAVITVRAWRVRGIPAGYWIDVVVAAGVRGIQGVTLELLAGMAAVQRVARDAERAAKAAAVAAKKDAPA